MRRDNKNLIKVVIVGAGKAGELISANLRKNKKSPFEIVGFVDDDKKKQSKKIDGIGVLGRVDDLRDLIIEYDIKEVFIAIPSERGRLIREVVGSTMGLRVTYKILPRLAEVLLQDFTKDYLRYIRKVKPADLLGGEILKTDQEDISKFAKNQTVLITGAAGSIGSELSRQLVAHGARRIIFFDWWENGMFELRNQLTELYPEGNYEFVIGDIKDKKKIDQVLAKFKPTTIFHAAAYKHVPLMEDNPSEAVKNNILGTKTVAESAIKYKVKKFVLVSSDKAVNPTSIMGATKRAAEKIVNILAKSQSDTIFCSVRFGNVVNSSGSVIPIFEKQIETGGPVTVTHREVTRYFMTIPEAVHLILQSWVMGRNNDLFVLDMGEPIKIYDLAKLLITLQGYKPEVDIQIEVVGLRPGEKLYEEVLVSEEETKATGVKKIFRTKNYLSFDKLAFISNLNILAESLEEEALNIKALKEWLQKMVSTYSPSKRTKKS